MAHRSGASGRAADGGISPRQACPCGSGKRYKACHGAPGGAVELPVSRPFEGLTAECELVALREFVPSATAPLTMRADLADVVPSAVDGRQVTLATVLPMAAAALTRADGSALVGLQVQTRSTDVSRDLGAALRWALTAEPEQVLPVVPAEPVDGPDPAPRLQDLLTDAELRVTVHPTFAWWIPEADEEPSSEVKLTLERANEAIMPTEPVTGDGVHAAYWVDAGEKAHLRWVRAEPEERLLPALARLSVAGGLDLGEDSRFVGSFRAHGVLVPVWDLDRERHAREWAQPAERFATRLRDALGSLDATPMTDAERRARDGLRGRQVTLR